MPGPGEVGAVLGTDSVRSPVFLYEVVKCSKINCTGGCTTLCGY